MAFNHQCSVSRLEYILRASQQPRRQQDARTPGQRVTKQVHGPFHSQQGNGIFQSNPSVKTHRAAGGIHFQDRRTRTARTVQ